MAMPEGLPQNIHVGVDSVLRGQQLLRRFFSERADAVTIGEHCHLEDVQLALGRNACVSVGDHVFAAGLILLAERAIHIGARTMFSFNVVIADSDYHPLDPAQRMLDAVAISPLRGDRVRPVIEAAEVVIEEDVWVGPNVTILKGVRIGAGAFIEPGSLVTRDVPAGARVLGNPAQIIGEV